MPCSAANRWRWWTGVLVAGPGWVVLGMLKMLGGAFLASLLIGLMQTFAVGLDVSVAPILPYVLMVLVLIFRPRGLAGARGD